MPGGGGARAIMRRKKKKAMQDKEKKNEDYDEDEMSPGRGGSPRERSPRKKYEAKLGSMGMKNISEEKKEAQLDSPRSGSIAQSDDNMVWDGDESEEEVDPNAHRLKPWFVGLAKYIVFIVTFTFIQIGLRPTAEMRQFTSLWDLAIGQSLYHVQFVDGLWTFLQGPVVSLVSSDYFQQINAYWPGDQNAYIYGNRRMGNIRIRQVRVKGELCRPTQKMFMVQDESLPPICYSQYDLGKDEGNYEYVWKNTTYTRSQSTTALRDLPCAEQGCSQTVQKMINGTAVSVLEPVCCSNLTHFNYISDKDLNESTVPFFASRYYWGGGYVVDLVDSKQATIVLNDLRYNQDWVDLKTRAVFVDFSFYNANLDLFVVARLVIELLPSGKCSVQKTFRVIQLNRYSKETSSGTMLLGCQLIMSVMLAWYTYDQLSVMYADMKSCRWRIFMGLRIHFGVFWNTFDFLILMIFYAVCGITALNEIEASELLLNLKYIDSSSLQTVGFWATQERNILGVLALVVWLKIFRYVTITVRLERLFVSLARAGPDLLTYFFLFALWMYAFSVAGILMFGNEMDEFADAATAILTCNRVMFGDFDFEKLNDANRVLGWMWLFGFSWTAIIILLNFFVAILCEVYAQVMEEYEGIEVSSIMDSVVAKAVQLLGLRNTAKVVASLEHKFQLMEEAGDGQAVSKVELAHFLQKEGAFEIFDTNEVTEVMARFDTNNSGFLDADEMKKIREVIKLKKQDLQNEIREVEAADIVPTPRGRQVVAGSRSSFLARRQRGGGQQAASDVAIRAELAILQDSVSEVSARLERQAQMEKKLLTAVETIAAKVEALVDREKDFKFLRKGLTGDYLS